MLMCYSNNNDYESHANTNGLGACEKQSQNLISEGDARIVSNTVGKTQKTTYLSTQKLIDLFHRPCLCYQLQSLQWNMYVLL